MLQTLSGWELAYVAGVLLFTFGLRGSVGFGGSVGLPLLALVMPVKVLAPAIAVNESKKTQPRTALRG